MATFELCKLFFFLVSHRPMMSYLRFISSSSVISSCSFSSSLRVLTLYVASCSFLIRRFFAPSAFQLLGTEGRWFLLLSMVLVGLNLNLTTLVHCGLASRDGRWIVENCSALWQITPGCPYTIRMSFPPSGHPFPQILWLLGYLLLTSYGNPEASRTYADKRSG